MAASAGQPSSAAFVVAGAGASTDDDGSADGGSDDGDPTDSDTGAAGAGQPAGGSAAATDPTAAQMAQAAAGVASPAQATTTPPVLGPQTVSQLSSALVQNIQAKASRFELALEPAGLGQVDVSIRIGADGAVSASLNFSNPQAADALKAHAGELRAALEQAGFTLGGSDLSFTTGGGSNSQTGQGAAGRSFATNAFTQIADIADIQAQAAAPPGWGSSASGLDIRI